MAMTMNGEVQLAAPRKAVWDKLNDPEVLKASIPGCEELETTDDQGFRATLRQFHRCKRPNLRQPALCRGGCGSVGCC